MSSRRVTSSLVGRLSAGSLDGVEVENGHGAVRHEDVAVRALMQTVDHAGRKAMVEDDERPLVRRHADVQPGHAGDNPGPGTRRIDDILAVNGNGFAGHAIFGVHADHASLFGADGRHFVIGQHFAAIAAGALCQTRRKPSIQESGTR